MEPHSDTESQTNEDSSDTNLGPNLNHVDSGVKNAGKHSTNSLNGVQNGLDHRNSPNRDVSAKQKSFSVSAKKTNNKKARHRWIFVLISGLLNVCYSIYFRLY